MPNTKDVIVRAAGKRGKTKDDLAAAAGVGYSTAAKHVNELVFAGRLKQIKKTEGGAGIFAKVDTEETLASTK